MKRLLLALIVLCTLVPAAPALAASDAPTERVVISGPVTIDSDETAEGVFVVSGDILIRGTVDGDVVVLDGDVTIRGEVTGNVVTVAGTAILGRRAQVGGDLTYIVNEPQVTRGAKVEGETTRYDADQLTGPLGIAAIGFWAAVGISIFLLGLILLLLAPRAGDAVAGTAKAKPLLSIVVGILVCILLPIIALAALVSIFGAPLGVILLMLLIPLGAIGYATAAFVLGRLIIKGPRIPAFVVGLIILRLLALIPFAGGPIGSLATVFGLGVVFMAMLRARGG